MTLEYISDSMGDSLTHALKFYGFTFASIAYGWTDNASKAVVYERRIAQQGGCCSCDIHLLRRRRMIKLNKWEQIAVDNATLLFQYAENKKYEVNMKYEIKKIDSRFSVDRQKIFLPDGRDSGRYQIAFTEA